MADWLDSRYRSVIAKQERNKTGLKLSDRYFHECKECGFQLQNKNPNPPTPCRGKVFLTGLPCGSLEFESWTEVDVEAAPLGLIKMDKRKRGERGW